MSQESNPVKRRHREGEDALWLRMAGRTGGGHRRSVSDGWSVNVRSLREVAWRELQIKQ